MIIESLYKHYKAEVLKRNPLYPPQGLESKRIHFVIVISNDGTLIDIEEREGVTNVIRSRQRDGVDARNIPNYMWDSLGYITGVGGCQQHHAAFKLMVREVQQSHPDNPIFKAVAKFYRRGVEQLFDHSLWSKVSSKKGHNITFRLVAATLTAAEQQELIQPITGEKHQCLITGEMHPIVRLHPRIYIAGAAGTGAKFVSFTKNVGYNSYHKTNGDNAPIAREVAEGYAVAISAMRQVGSGHQVVIGDVTLLFFGDGKFSQVFNKLFYANEEDLSAWRDSKERFEIIAIVANVARISSRLHITTTVGEIVQNIEQLYSYIGTNTAIVQSLMIIAPYHDVNRLSSQFIVDYISATLKSKEPPKQLLNMLLKPQPYHPIIIGLIRYYISETFKTNIPMALDKDYTNTGYLLGRMLAIVERAQTSSQPTLTYTIKDQTYATLSVTPAALYNRVVSLSMNYFRRIPRQGTQIYLKMLLSEVAAKISAHGVPMRLSLEDQGRFALGYQHQNQSFYTKREEDEPNS